jgi:alpha-L-arabinofuranosidase
MTDPRIITIDPAKPLHAVSPNLYGIFFEDINFSCDGGINANTVNNYSFDGVYLNRKKKEPAPDHLRYWMIKNGTMQSSLEGSLSPNSRYARISAKPGCTLENLGYNGLKANGNNCAMSVERSREYSFECYIRNVDFAGTASARIADENGNSLTTAGGLACDSHSWQKVDCRLEGCNTGYGKLSIKLDGSGAIDLDCVVFMASDYWNKEDPKWRHGKLRKDLVRSLAALKPSFVRFPGGCIVEGMCSGNEYNWKDTVGPIHARKHNFNLWAGQTEDGGYCQSYQIGFYEYFCLCEDLGAKPLPTLFAGLNCQVRSIQKIATNSREFREYVIQNYLDLIEFANGDPEKNEWAKLRRDMGHPAPFNLDRIGIGNENFGKDYRAKFKLIKNVIHARYPGILCVMSSGLFPFKLFQKGSWDQARKSDEELLVDEHSYHSTRWFIKAAHRFDEYPRGKAKVYFGEYAANGMMAGKIPAEATANLYESALAEAAFLTGIERNSDVVMMASYAPLFNLVESKQWMHNLIDFNPAEVCPTANYFVQMLFSGNIGDQYIPFDGTLPENVAMSVTGDDSKIFIKIVNTGGKSCAMSLHLEGTDSRRVSSQVLQSDDLKAKNHLTFNGKPQMTVGPKDRNLDLIGGKLDIVIEKYSVNVFNMLK